jgi:hypothetical protein
LVLVMDSDPAYEKAQAQFDQILHLIGQVVIAWGELDDSLIHLLARLSGCRLKSAGITYYALDAFSTRLTVITGLAQHKLRKGKNRDNLLAILSKLSKLGTARNDIVHAVYRVVFDPKRGKRGKWVIKKWVFRSARKELYQETLAQTGELKTHLDRLRGFRTWFALSGWHPQPAKLPPELQAKIVALKTDMATPSKSN